MEGIEKYLPHSSRDIFTKKLFDLSTAIIVLIDKKEGLIAANKAFGTLLPFESAEAFIKTYGDISELFISSPNTLSAVETSTWLLELSRSKEKNERVRILDKNGKERLFHIRAEEASVEGKAFYIVQLEDITTIENAKHAENYYESFKQKFLGSLSHEFRTPMNGIIGFTQLLERTQLNPSQKEYLDFIAYSAQTMMSNVENLLELAQIESGQIGVHEHRTNPIEMLENFSYEFKDASDAKTIELFFYIDPRLPKFLMADGDKIKRVLKNLIKNAIKYSREKANVYVEIRVIDAGKKEEILVEYSVTDTGPGIEQNRLGTIIRPFASVKENQNQGQDGLGIGLSLCHKLTRMMQSSLKIATELNKGSRFSFSLHHKTDNISAYTCIKGTRMAIWAEDYFTIAYAKLLKEYLEHFEVEVIETEGLANKELKQCDAVFIVTDHLSSSRIKSIRSQYAKLQIIPVINPFNEDKFETVLDETDGILMKPLLPGTIYAILNELWKKVPPEVSKRTEPSPKKLRVLVAEDNPVNLKFIQTILSQYGLKVASALNGKEAVECFEKEKGFDLVFMDIDMPVMDGITATRRIKEIEKKSGQKVTPVVALTAHGLLGDRERIVKAGLDDYLAKPFERAKLEAVLRQYLDLEIN